MTDILLDFVRSFFWFGGIIFWLGCFIFMRSGADTSNVLNFIRVFAHVCKHSGELLRAYYVSAQGVIGKPIFPYVKKDEFSEIVDTRP